MKEQQNFLLILRFRNENVKHVFIDHRQKISADKSKQTSTFLEIIQNSDKPSFETREAGFRASAYLFKFMINGLQEVGLGLLTFILGARGSPKKLS